ncbi:MAG: RagB/SusD family nutrient uptake outer membrane protein [Candidatus Dojkabacteria bacterium]
MKKIIIKNTKVFTLLLTIGILGSCNKDFLNEELTTQRSSEYYKTEEGIQSLAAGAYYRVFSAPFGGEVQLATTNSGTDEFHIGGDASNGAWNNYDGGFKSVVTVSNANTVSSDAQWDNLYIGINLANNIIQSATEIQSTNNAIKKTALGEGYFFRAFNYLKLVRQYGGVPLKLNVSTTLELEYTRAKAEEVYTQIIEDFTKAYDLLDNTGPSPAKITKDAAAHYLAKAYLSRASEINDSFNSATKQADLQKVVTLADEVITRHPLATNYNNLWAYTAPNGANENLSELILSAQFTRDVAATGGNFSTVIFTARYDDLPYMQRDLTGMRPYSRLAPTYFTYDVFDQVNDSRFWKSFRTKHRLNKGSGKYVNGDLGIMYVINKPTDIRFAKTKYVDEITYAKTGKTIPTVYVAHSAASTTLLLEPRFPSLSKHFDAARLSVNETRGLRDEILARSAETYLMAAEAKVRLASLGMGTYNAALPYINAVRTRATFKASEDRSAYIDGGAAFPTSELKQDVNLNSYITENSYYESNNIANTTAATNLSISDFSSLPVEDEAVITKLGYTSQYDRILCFILDERTRELCGEFLRWEDLSRTKTLVKRAKAYNPEAITFIQDYHLLRAIPQRFLDGVYKDGKLLSAAEKQALQNPGY